MTRRAAARDAVRLFASGSDIDGGAELWYHMGGMSAAELVSKAPFNFDATMHKPDHFPTGGER
jgi:hypothetical protein